MAESPMQLSLAYLREQGYICDVVEHRVPHTNVTRDAFGIADIIAIHPAHQGTLYVQTTTRSNQAARRKKILESGHLSTIVGAGNRVHVHGWAKVGPRGERKTWEPTIWTA